MKPLTRRFFLRGAGGTALAIPTLPSLLSAGEARAQAAASAPIFVSFHSDYGGCWASNFFPAMATPDEQKTYAGRQVKRKALAVGSGGKLSEVLWAPGLTPALAAKMNIVQGVDFPFDVNHHNGASLGNYGSGDAPNAVGDNLRLNKRPTIDQVMAASSSFYPSLNGVTQRSVFLSEWAASSYRYKDAANKASGVESVPALRDGGALWDALFRDYTGGAAAPRASIIDLVYQDYTRLKANPRLAAADKARLDEHLTRVADIQRRLTVTSSCAKPTRPGTPATPVCGQPDTQVSYYKTYQDILVAALQCGLTRVAHVYLGGSVTFGERCNSDWHWTISHAVQDASPQASMVAAYRKQFAELIVPLVAKLDGVIDAQGKSLLDRSIVYWAHEHGQRSHGLENLPVVMFGGARGAMKTGNHIDVRDSARAFAYDVTDGPMNNRRYVGLTVHQMLGSVLQLMGVPKAEWQESNHGGYGYRPPRLDPRQDMWNATDWAAAGDVLPFLT